MNCSSNFIRKVRPAPRFLARFRATAANGTYINDVARGRISRTALRDGDVIIVGEPDCLSLQVKFG